MEYPSIEDGGPVLCPARICLNQKGLYHRSFNVLFTVGFDSGDIDF